MDNGSAAKSQRLPSEATHLTPVGLPAPVARPGFLGHPREFWTLAFVELWERFGFYLMMSLLVLYMNERWQMSEAEAMTWFGYYVTAVYFSPLLGGYIAERGLSRPLWVAIGASLLSIGYFGFALASRETMVIWFSLLVLGNGLFKPNIATLVGSLYAPGDPRRDGAFSYFYFAVNVGGAISPLVGGYLRMHFGWRVAFSAAGVGLIFAVMVLLRFARRHKHTVLAQAAVAAQAQHATSAARRVAALILISACALPFWTAIMQSGTSLALWARDNTDRTLSALSASSELAPEQFSSLGSWFIILLTVPLTAVLDRLNRGRGVHSAVKIVVGLLLAATAFALMSFCAGQTGSGRASMLWLVGYYFVFTIGELMLSPVGLSIVSKLAPPRWVGVMIGVWLLSTASGNLLVGLLGRYWARWSHSQYFAVISIGLLSSALLMLSQLRWLRRVIPSQPS
jgi:POT family proton-dependent oligopeptide transporter